MKSHLSFPLRAVVTAIVFLLASSGRQHVLAEGTPAPPTNRIPESAKYHENSAIQVTLMKAAKDSNPDIRAAAVYALGDLQIHSAVPLLITLLGDSFGLVRDAAAEALSVLHDQSAVPALIAKLQGESKILDPPVPEAGGLVIDTQHSFNPLPEELRLQAIQLEIVTVRSLGALHDARAADALLEYGLKSPAISVQMAAALALGRIGGARAAHALEEVLAACYRSLPQEQPFQLVIDDRFASTPVRALQQQSYLRTALAWSLGAIGQKSSLPVLRQALEDKNSIVRDNAAEAVDKIQGRHSQ